MNEATKANFHDPIFERRPTVLQPRAAIGTKGVSPLLLSFFLRPCCKISHVVGLPFSPFNFLTAEMDRADLVFV